MWKYEVSNTDHTLMQGVELVNRLLLGEPEITIGMKYESTADGRTRPSTNAASSQAAATRRRPVVKVGSVVSATAKTSTERATIASHPGQATKGSLDKAISDLVRPAAGHRDPGDKAEAQVQEELGITTPTKEVAND